jgi:hypothetical protein
MTMSKDSSSFSNRPALLGGVMALAMLSACNNVPAAGNAVLMSNSATPAADKAGAAPAAQAAASDLDPILANPQVGDLYAAELTAFSAQNFGSAGPNESGNSEKAYGLLRVVDVSPDRVTVITETSAWPNSRGAVNDLRGDLANITWDEQERIPINRTELARMVADGKIVETRRMEGAAAGGGTGSK